MRQQEPRVLNLIGGAEGYLCSQSIKPALTPIKARLPFPRFFFLSSSPSPKECVLLLASLTQPSLSNMRPTEAWVGLG
jgi:hypothetical protein